jgi:hypothetical protein
MVERGIVFNEPQRHGEQGEMRGYTCVSRKDAKEQRREVFEVYF